MLLFLLHSRKTDLSVSKVKSDMSEKPSFMQVTKSVLAAMIGVQSEKNRQKDFQSASIWPFIIGGVIFTAVFVLVLILLVRSVT